MQDLASPPQMDEERLQSLVDARVAPLEQQHAMTRRKSELQMVSVSALTPYANYSDPSPFE